MANGQSMTRVGWAASYLTEHFTYRLPLFYSKQLTYWLPLIWFWTVYLLSVPYLIDNFTCWQLAAPNLTLKCLPIGYPYLTLKMLHIGFPLFDSKLFTYWILTWQDIWTENSHISKMAKPIRLEFFRVTVLIKWTILQVHQEYWPGVLAMSTSWHY